MALRVGIPRALFYYYYYPQWETFFRELGAETVLSSPTHKGIIEAGVRLAVDEACLPVKVFYGHVIELSSQVDYLFLPRLVSVEHKSYICPKFMGLPDMIKSNIPGLPQIIDLCVDLSRDDRQYLRDLHRVGRIFTRNPWKIKKAIKESLRSMEHYRGLLSQGQLPAEALENIYKCSAKNSKDTKGSKSAINAIDTIDTINTIETIDRNKIGNIAEPAPLTIGLLGHGYTIYDEYISRQTISKLREMGVKVVTQDILSKDAIEEGAGQLPKRMFWSLGKQILGGAFHFFDKRNVDGVVHLACFGCGPDSLIAELVEIEAHRRKDLPFMMLTVDEHTGEAGIITRLEAFIDMIRRQQKLELAETQRKTG